jgi:hypothetical protein
VPALTLEHIDIPEQPKSAMLLEHSLNGHSKRPNIAWKPIGLKGVDQRIVRPREETPVALNDRSKQLLLVLIMGTEAAREEACSPRTLCHDRAMKARLHTAPDGTNLDMLPHLAPLGIRHDRHSKRA